MSGFNLVLYLLSICLSGAGAWFVIRYGHRLDLLDKPNDRSSHLTTKPKGGGVGILAGFIVVTVTIGLPIAFWASAAILSAISLWGDRLEISPLFRLLFQFSASLIFLTGIWHEQLFSDLGYVMILPFSIFIVATTNYYNFMDGINGIAGITGVVGFGLLSFYSFSSKGNPSILTLNTCLSLGCLGFLPFNFPQAKVFMGDVGSILLGFVFATMVVWLSKSFLDFVCLSSFLFPFYADELTTLIVRVKDGDRLTRPHRKHLYQLLANEMGIAHWKVSAVYGGLQLSVGVSILLMRPFGNHIVLAILCIYFVVFLLFSSTIRKKCSCIC